MITFFTTTKNFTSKNLINQVNAVKSWTIGNKHNCEVIIFQKSLGHEILLEIPGVVVVDKIESNDAGVPYINEMFYKASLLAKYDILCFLNADIIISDLFVEKLATIHRIVRKQYLVVGQRIDTSFEFLIDFQNENWWEALWEGIANNSKIHPPLGSDFFAFPKEQYNTGMLPNLLVGRPGWDLYMIYHARKNKLKLIDLSSSYKVIHQSHDYGHKNSDESIKGAEDQYNLSFFPENEKYEYVLSYCNYKLTRDDVVIKSYNNFEFRKYYKRETRLYNLSFINRFFLKMEILLQRMRIKYYRK